MADDNLEPLYGGIDGNKYLPYNGKYRIVPKPGQVYYGQMSWFGWFEGKHDWDDHLDNGRNASGLAQSVPGIAYHNKDTIKHWWKLTFPNKKTVIVRQVDLGPAGWTGKIIDVNASLADMIGYSPRTFPTGKLILFQYINKEKPPYGATEKYKG